ncbi:MAG: HEAT repeat domain-containing protein [Proteobacteria bacterium]|nr:HEAT repeat domain-containing protein [Pseudomonadota bacterium]
MKKQEKGRISKGKMARLIKALKEGDSFDKEKAIETLVAFPDKTVIEQVIPLLDGNVTQARMSAWEVLKKVGHHNIEAVAALLDHESEDIRVYAAEILGTLKEKSTLPQLIKKIHDESPNVRNVVCIALGSFNDEIAVDALLEALHDDDWIAFSAIEALGKTGNERAVKPLLAVFKDGSEEVSLAACEGLMGFNDEKIKNEIFDILKRWEPDKRGIFVDIILDKVDDETFGNMKERMGQEVFEHLFNSVRNDTGKPVSLIRLLAHFRRTEACDAILYVLSSMNPDDEEYTEVLNVFAHLSDVWKDRIAYYVEQNEGYVMPVIESCKIAGVEIAEALLLKIFLATSMEVKREIIKNLPVFLKGGGLSVIKEAIKDPDGHVRGDALTVIGIMSLEVMKDDVIAAVRKGFLDVRIHALKALMRLDFDNGLELIRTFVNSGSDDDKRLYLAVAKFGDADNNFPFVVKLLSDEDDKIRRAVIGVIGYFLDDERYMAMLVKLLMDENISHETLKVIREKRLTIFRDRLQEIFQDTDKELWTRYYALSALSTFEDGSLFDTFVNGLKDDNSIIKIACIKALADLNDVRALEHIYPFAQSDDNDVRSTAEFVIGRLEGF